MLHQWFTCVHLLDTYLANLKEGFQLSFHYPSVSIRAAQSGLQSVPAYRMRWGCHHLFRSYDGNPSNIANIRLHSVSGHTILSAKIQNIPDSPNVFAQNVPDSPNVFAQNVPDSPNVWSKQRKNIQSLIHHILLWEAMG